MEIQNTCNLDIQITQLVEAYAHSQHSLFLTRKNLTKALFEYGNIKTEDDFKKIKNYLELAFNKNFINTRYYENIAPNGIVYRGQSLSCDIQYYDEGIKLSRDRMATKSKGLLSDDQKLILEVYKHLKMQIKNFIRTIKYAFDLHVQMLKAPEAGSLLEFHKTRSKNADDSKNILVVDKNDQMNVDDQPHIEPVISEDDFRITSYTGDIDDADAQMILRDIIRGNLLDPEVWINDDCINCYLNCMLTNLAKELDKDVAFIPTYFFQTLYFDNPNLVGYYESNYEKALPYWKESNGITLVPINIKNSHWTLLSINKQIKTIEYHDSLGCYNGEHGSRYIDVLLTFMSKYEIKQIGGAFDAGEWTLRSSREIYQWNTSTDKYTDVPQKNGYDCGLFLIKFAEMIVRHSTLKVLGAEDYPNRQEIKRQFVGLYVKYQSKKFKSTRETIDDSCDEESIGSSRASDPGIVTCGDGPASDSGVRAHSASGTTVDSDASQPAVESSKTVDGSSANTSTRVLAKRSKTEANWGHEFEASWKRAKPDRVRTDIVLRHDALDGDDGHIEEKLTKKVSVSLNDLNLSSINADDNFDDNVDELLSTSKRSQPGSYDDNISELSIPTTMEDNKPDSEQFMRLIDDYVMARSNVKIVFYFPTQDILFEQPQTWKSEVLKIFYRLEDFDSYVTDHIDGKLRSYKQLMSHIKYGVIYQNAKTTFSRACSKVRVDIRASLHPKFPKARDLNEFPIETFTDLIIKDNPIEDTTIIENPPTFPEATEIVIQGVEKVDESESLTYVTAHSQPTITLSLRPDDITSYIRQQRALFLSEENKQIYEAVLHCHEYQSVPATVSATDKTTFPLVGLPNMGNSCYINSSLQCLFRITYLQQLLKDYDAQTDSNDGFLIEILKDINDSMVDFVNNLQQQRENKLTYNIKKNYMRVLNFTKKTLGFSGRGTHEDAGEFIRSILNRLHYELKRGFVCHPDTSGFVDANIQITHAAKMHWAWSMSEDHYSKIKEIFYHQVIWTTKCLLCNQSKYVFQINDKIMVHHNDSFEGIPMKVIQYLERQYGTETLPHSKCDICEEKDCTLERTPRICRTPSALIVTLDFYKFDENKAVKSSVKNQIVFQTEIDISSICHESILAGSSALSENSYKKVYNTFIGCVAHKGLSGDAGHYIALVKDGVQGGQQHLYNVIDDKVINGKPSAGRNKSKNPPKQPPLTAEDLQEPENRFCNDGYILFYE